MSDQFIRMATLEDAEEILAIYEPYILKSTVTFELEAIPPEEFRERIKKVQSRYPWLVYIADGRIAGYAYASLYRERAAYAWDCECSVYIAEGYKRKGIASALYSKLFEILEKQGFVNVYAFITMPNDNSVILHEKFGFSKVGILEKTGHKLGAWRDVLIMAKQLQPHPDNNPPEFPKPVREVL